jgi:ABC-type transport system substrate-binding protein
MLGQRHLLIGFRKIAACAARRGPLLLGLFGLLALAACSPEPVNSPYTRHELATNTLFTAFTQRSPKHLDPASSYSTDETPFTYSIYEPLYAYHYLKRPYTLQGRSAQAVAQPAYYDANGQELPADAPGEQVAVSVYDIPVRDGIRYQPHPAFAKKEDGHYWYWPVTQQQLQGKFGIDQFTHTGTRQLTAHDFVYAFKRLASPRVVSPVFGVMAEHIEGMHELAKQLKQADQALRASDPSAWLDLRKFNLTGVQAVNDHTLRIRVKGKYPQFKYWLAMTFTAPVAWEVDRFYNQPGMARHTLSLDTWPVGTGPYMMVQSIVNRRHVLQRNPNYYRRLYPCQGEPGDRETGLLDDCGKPVPFIDRIVFSLEKESVPLMGKFIQGYYDIPQADSGDYGVAMTVAASDSAEKAALYKDHGLVLRSATEASVYYFGFNWKDPVVGQGDTPEQAGKNRKLRQAISIAFDWEQYVAIFQNDQAQVAHGPVPPGVPGYQSPPQGMNERVYEWKDGHVQRRSLDQARELLAQAGYPDGRDKVTGKPLILYFDSAGGMGSSPMLDWMRRQLGRLNIQLEIRATDYNRFQDKMRNGSAQMYMWGWVADYPDPENFLFLLYGPNAKVSSGGENASNYSNPRFDKLFEQMRFLDDGPERDALVHEMVKIVQYDAPWMFGYYPKSGGAYQSWVHNAKPSQMVRDTLSYYRIDPAERARKIALWNPPIWWPLWFLGGLLLVGVALAGYVARQRDRAVAVRTEHL